MLVPPADTLGRPLRALRISVTDRCNLRCAYCMPERDYVWLPRADILTFEEASALTDRFAELGVDKVRLTGGEPLLRQDLPDFVALLAAKPALRDLSLTTNGVLLRRYAAALRQGGLHRVTVSVDTLRAERFRSLTRRDDHHRVLDGITAAAEAGFRGLKLNAVVMRGFNDDEIFDLLAFGREHGAEVRFIEYMDVGGATRWSSTHVVPRREILQRLAERYGAVTAVRAASSAPAERFALPDGTTFGVIASTTEPFCRTCDRARLTADGMFYTCLYTASGLDLRAPLRRGAAPAELRALIGGAWSRRDDRGAEERLRLAQARSALAQATEMRRNPHLEMHTRGG
jgi:cyclic pyranopterin phosphate synthase